MPASRVTSWSHFALRCPVLGRVMSFNIRTSAMDSKDGENAWDNRKETVAEIVKKYRPAVVGMQVCVCW